MTLCSYYVVNEQPMAVCSTYCGDGGGKHGFGTLNRNGWMTDGCLYLIREVSSFQRVVCTGFNGVALFVADSSGKCIPFQSGIRPPPPRLQTPHTPGDPTTRSLPEQPHHRRQGDISMMSSLNKRDINSSNSVYISYYNNY